MQQTGSLPDVRLRDLHQGYAQAVAVQQRQHLLGLAVLLGLLGLSAWTTEVDLLKFFSNIGNFTSYIDRLSRLESGERVVTDPIEWFWGWKIWLIQMGETLLMAYVGTLAGACGALGLCFLASRNITANRALVFAAKRLLEFARTVPELVFAMIFIMAFSLGPMPGVLALAIHSMGSLGKLFSEVVENIDMKPVDGVLATGGSWWQKIYFAVMPQVFSSFVSYTLLRFEVNVRSAAVLGFVGAGGIGQTLIEAIRKFYYADVSALLVLIVLTVMLMDQMTQKLRARILGMELRA
jgi:phosphonate transport system permease protein